MKRRLLWLFVFVIFVVVSIGAFTLCFLLCDERRLQGTWTEEKYNVPVTFNGDVCEFVDFPGGAFFQFDSNATPKRIVFYDATQATRQPRTFLGIPLGVRYVGPPHSIFKGIYELDGDNVRIAVANSHTFPTAFDAEDVALLNLRRER